MAATLPSNLIVVEFVFFLGGIRFRDSPAGELYEEINNRAARRKVFLILSPVH
jgi:hypothetical protein